jgi:flagellin-like protein
LPRRKKIFRGGAKKKMKTFRKSTKGLSPIFATLILIAIAVIAGIVVYMFTSGTIAGLTGQGGAGSEKLSIQAVQGDATAESATFWAKSVSGGTINIDTVILKSASGTTLEVLPMS